MTTETTHPVKARQRTPETAADSYQSKTVAELKDIARALKLTVKSKDTKATIIAMIQEAIAVRPNSSALFLSDAKRADNYRRQNNGGTTLTAAQVRRSRKKINKQKGDSPKSRRQRA